MNCKTILIKYASRGRYDMFLQRLKDIKATAADIENMYVVVTNDKDDGCMMHAVNVAEAYRVGLPLMMRHAEPSNKITAINAHVNDLTVKWDILVCMSDDMIPQIYGWDNIIRYAMHNNFPDTDGVLHFNDGFQRKNIMTLSIIGNRYYERDKYIYNPLYKSVWCDAEATEVAYIRGKIKYIGDEPVIFKHHHPSWGLAQTDDMYRINENPVTEALDKATFMQRRAAWYGIPESERVNGYYYKINF